jgi:hypothetical protein
MTRVSGRPFRRSSAMTFSGRYILDGKIPVPCEDLLQWGAWMETGDRVLKQEQVGQFWVSTVFLGLDHQYGAGPPRLFETMVFDAGRDGIYQSRYSTWELALEGHERAVAWAKGLMM